MHRKEGNKTDFAGGSATACWSVVNPTEGHGIQRLKEAKVLTDE
jgi:hypothetical protein